jgi:hypothetical protein
MLGKTIAIRVKKENKLKIEKGQIKWKINQNMIAILKATIIYSIKTNVESVVTGCSSNRWAKRDCTADKQHSCN